MNWEKEAEDGVVRKEETGKAKEDVYVVKEDMAEEKENPLWRPLMGKAEKRRSRMCRLSKTVSPPFGSRSNQNQR